MQNNRATIFFLHIPKNSGTTLNTIIRENYQRVFKVSWDKSDSNYSENILLRKNASVFSQYEVVRGHFPYGLHEALPMGAPYIYFTMLRDPLRRTWSQYNYLRNDSSYINQNPELQRYLRDLPLDVYCRTDHPSVPNHVFTDNAQVRYLSGVGDSKPFGAVNDEDLALAKERLLSMPFGITEEFDRSVLHLQQVLGWKRILYTKQKVSSRPAVKPTLEDVKSLKACNQLDLQLYAWALEVFRKKTSAVSVEDLSKYKSQLSRYQFIARSKRAVRDTVRGLARGLTGRQRTSN